MTKRKPVTYDEILKRLKSHADPDAVAGMARFGIKGAKVLGVKIPVLRKMARECGRDHRLAGRLWREDCRETRILAAMIDDPKAVTESQMERWAGGFDSWEVCDQACMNLFWLTPFAYEKAVEWAAREGEFVKRAGFALMAVLAWKDKKAPDGKLAEFLPVIEREAGDKRNFVKKAVNWALRQIGKRNPALNKKAVAAAKKIAKQDSPAAKWVASDALRELTGEAVRKRLRGKRR